MVDVICTGVAKRPSDGILSKIPDPVIAIPVKSMVETHLKKQFLVSLYDFRLEAPLGMANLTMCVRQFRHHVFYLVS